MSNRARAAVIAGGLGALVAVVLRGQLAAAGTHLPGLDAVGLHSLEVFTREALSSGRLPHWNPYYFSGQPHLADPQTTVLYPPALLLRWIPLPQYFTWHAALHVWIGAVGGLFFARVLRAGWLAATMTAVVVGVGGSVGPWLHDGHLLILSCAAWLPWVFGLSVMSVRRHALLPHLALPLVLTVQFLTGYLQGTLYTVIAVSAYFVYCAVVPDRPAQRSRWMPLAQLAALGALTFALSAFQLLPTLRLIGDAARTSGLPYKDAVEGAWSLRDLATLYFPFAAGGHQDYRSVADATAYIGWLSISMVPFAFLDRARRHGVWFFAGLAMVAIALMCATDVALYRVHYALFPGLRMPGRVLILATLSLAVLSGIGVERLAQLVRARQWRPILAGVIVVLAAVAISAWAAVPGRAAAPPSHGWPWLPIAGAIGAVVIPLAGLAVGGRVLQGAVAAFAVLDVCLFAAGGIAPVGFVAQAEARVRLGQPDGRRALSLCEHMAGSNEMLITGQPGVDGPALIQLTRYADWAYITKFGDPLPRDGVLRRIGSDGPMPARRDLLDSADVSTIVSCAPVDQPGLSRVPGGRPYVYRNAAAWPRAIWTCDSPRLPADVIIDELLTTRYNHARRLFRSAFINVRWSERATDAERDGAARRYHLSGGARQDARTWRYALEDQSLENTIALIQDPLIEDTAGLDRGTGAITPPPPAPADRLRGRQLDDGEVLVGSAPCPHKGDVTLLAKDQPDGHLALRAEAPVAGLVFVSEQYYAERAALVDGRRVEPVRANLAFTAVPVPAGSHHVELRYEPTSFYAGAGITGATVATLGMWLTFGARRRARTVATPDAVDHYAGV